MNVIHPPETVYRYAYSSKAGDRCLARVTIYRRAKSDGYVMLMLRCVGGTWPDNPDLSESATRGVPVCKGVLLPADEEASWCAANLLAEF